jgi:hypothetical protein
VPPSGVSAARSAVRRVVPEKVLSSAIELVEGRPAARSALRAARAGGRGEAGRPAYRRLISLLTGDCDSVLDIGTGTMRSLAALDCRVRIGLEAHRPYLEHRELPDAVPINASALDLERLFVAGAVDLVQMIDVLEHFAPDDADRVLEQAARVARRRVVLFTPRGEFPQEGFDASNLGGEELQQHRSSWEPEDLEARGYRVVVMRGFHGPWNEAFVAGFGRDAPPVDALLAFRDL